MTAPKPSLADRLRAATPLQLALLFSLFVHALLLTVQLATPGSVPRRWVESKLELILVNARDKERPLQAQALAQANLRGGGDGSPNERAQSPLPPSDELSLGDSATETRRRVQALQVEQQQLLTALRRDLARLPPPDQATDAASPEGRQLTERRRLLLEQMAELERRVNEHNAPPRQRYVSPATQEVVYAAYYDQLRRRIEARGTRDFPSLGGRKLYGQLTMNISVDARGRVLDTEVVEPSGTPALDSRAAAIVRAASPFGGFSKAMRAEAEVLVLSARFTFDREQGVQAELRGGAALMQRYAVIGHPIAHSRSPAIHAAFAAQFGIALQYERVEAPLDGFAATVASLRAQGYSGCNVTLPFKPEALALAADASERARLAGAANTLGWHEDGALWADNTDGLGLLRDIEVNAGCSLAGRRILLLGAGGASAGCLAPLIEARPERLRVWNRSAGKAEQLVARHRELAARHGVQLEAGALDGEHEAVINGTSAALGGQGLSLPPGLFAPGALALDMVYGAAAAPFLEAAAAQGAGPCRDGLGMLVEQAAEAFARWHGRRPDTAPVLAQLRAS